MQTALPTNLPNLVLYATVVGALVVVGLTIMGAIAFWRGKESADAFTTLIQRANIIQMLAVVMIIMAAVGLRLLDKITPDAVVTMLSGIAGYVLGGADRVRRDTQRQTDTRSDQTIETTAGRAGRHEAHVGRPKTT